jgi:hypothetical protein
MLTKLGDGAFHDGARALDLSHWPLLNEAHELVHQHAARLGIALVVDLGVNADRAQPRMAERRRGLCRIEPEFGRLRRVAHDAQQILERGDAGFGHGSRHCRRRSVRRAPLTPARFAPDCHLVSSTLEWIHYIPICADGRPATARASTVFPIDGWEGGKGGKGGETGRCSDCHHPPCRAPVGLCALELVAADNPVGDLFEEPSKL